MSDDFPWVTFWFLSLVIAVPVFYFTPGFKFKVTFVFATFIGVYFALAGKSIRYHN